MSIFERRRETFAFCILAAVYFVSRFFHLDSDPPIWSISYYCIIDELYYTAFAFDMVHGTAPFDVVAYNPFLSLLQPLATAPSLAVLGNNYYGLRFPSIAFGFIVLLFFYLLALARFGLLMAFLSSFVLIAEFSFVLATRIAEPTIFRMAAMIALIYACTRVTPATNPRFIFVIGILAGVSWAFVYITNAFVVLGCLLAIAHCYRDRLIVPLFFYIAGVALALAVYATAVLTFGFTLEDLWSTVRLGSSKVAGLRESGSFLAVAEENLVGVLRANFIAKNPFFSSALLSSFFLFVFFRKRSSGSVTKADVVVFLFGLSLLAQSLFVNDYPERKMVILLPIALYLLCVFFSIWSKILRESLFITVALVLFVGLLVELAQRTYLVVYENPRYQYKAAMEKLVALGDTYFVGGWSQGFRLYGTYKPYLNKYAMIYTKSEEYYKTMKDHAAGGRARYTIEYDNNAVGQLRDMGFEKTLLLLRSEDSSYPDIYLFEYRPSSRNLVTPAASAPTFR